MTTPPEPPRRRGRPPTTTPPPLGPYAAAILALLLEGVVDHKEIGRRLDLSPHTVGHYCDALRHAHDDAPSIAAMTAALHEADKAALRAEYAALDKRVNARPDRRSGTDRRAPE